ncbi:MAG: preprotein translocase subunit SecA [Pseudomonadales bacterium]|nr:preprotein translocase subunit SecA [Pseudomonadales bacterium]
MIGSMFSKVFGTKNNRELKRMNKVVSQVNTFEEEINQLSDEQIRAKTSEFRGRVAEGEALDAILPEAFALVREAGVRSIGLRHFDSQIIGGITLHEGRIAEMRTGEGKTLVATLPTYLNSLTGEGVHVVTVNDYLAERDALWMKPLYEFLGLTVGIVLSRQDQESKLEAYAADITYGTNNEFGFDYLRDNMALSLEDKAQRTLGFAVVDEVDSILIDEARTPLIISGPSDDSSELYKKINVIIPDLTKGDEPTDEPPEDFVEGHYTVDEKNRQVELTEKGHEYIEDLMIEQKLLEEGDSLYSATNLSLLHHVHSALKAHILFHKDVDYIVQNGQIVIVDEHTGRTMPGRRWSDGIHQAVEAKEGVKIQSENQTLASTTFQNYFRLFDKLSGMTGTADTEAFEFRQIYGLDVVVIPTNKPMVRIDHEDIIFLTQEEKFEAIIEDIVEVTAEKRPVLVGTASIETSEFVSNLLDKANISHRVLNAKFHEQEAEIIAQAGQPGKVTIATNMAGRGTDIVLGGNWQAEIAAIHDPSDEKVTKIKTEWEERNKTVIDAGGLHILSTERHESRRIDNQLRGRSGRQGDPGSSRFYLSLEDNLMRIFASDKVKSLMKTLGMEHGEAIEHRWVTKSIENAQKKVEGRNFDIRKSLLEYDDVANDQRQVVYQQRNDILSSEDIADTVEAIREDVVNGFIDEYVPPQSIDEQWDIPGLENSLFTEFRTKLPVQQWLDEDDSLHEETLRTKIVDHFVAAYNEKEASIGDSSAMRQLEKQVMLQVLDRLWKEHLSSMDYLRQGIHLRGYAQKNPKQEYKRESFELFQGLLEQIKEEVTRILTTVELKRQDEVEEMERQRRAEAEREMEFKHAESHAMEADKAGENQTKDPQQAPYVRTGEKVGRNQHCPCGSGKKFKHCHGKVA